jgi:hypothetical protein
VPLVWEDFPTHLPCGRLSVCRIPFRCLLRVMWHRALALAELLRLALHRRVRLHCRHPGGLKIPPGGLLAGGKGGRKGRGIGSYGVTENTKSTKMRPSTEMLWVWDLMIRVISCTCPSSICALRLNSWRTRRFVYPIR